MSATVINRILRLQVEAVGGFPFTTYMRLHSPVLGIAAEQAKWFVRRGLLDVGQALQRTGGRRAAEADVGEPRLICQIDPQQQVVRAVIAPSGCPHNTRAARLVTA